MQTFITNLTAFCSFFLSVLGDIANWFIGNPLGLLILGLSLFGVIVEIVFKVFNIFHK